MMSVSYFIVGSVIAGACVVLAAARFRGGLFARFGAVLLTIHISSSAGVAAYFWQYWPILVYLQFAVLLNLLLLIWAQMRPAIYRYAISNTSAYLIAGTFLSIPWSIAQALGWSAPLPELPFVIAAIGVLQSSFHRREARDIVVDGAETGDLRRFSSARISSDRTSRPLKLVQITDPHLGPFMSEHKLRRLCERAVAKEPDLVLLTGDFLTMESMKDGGPLTRSLAPLQAMPGRVFACFGNHDHEAPEIVKAALKTAGARLLNDEVALIETEAGTVEIVGLDFHFRDRRERIERVFEAHPRTPGAFRLVLLHDPGAFRHVPDGEADLVLSGHTHGGQLGLVSLGLPYTVVGALTQIPDHGLWAKGKNRLYVHRGTGHYGFPLRLGVPTEDSLLRVHWLNGDQ